jgi:hypothetical protein
LEIGNLLLQPADSIGRLGGRRRGGRSSAFPRGLLWFGRGPTLLGETRGRGQSKQKHRSCQYIRQARSTALNQSRRVHGVTALSEASRRLRTIAVNSSPQHGSFASAFGAKLWLLVVREPEARTPIHVSRVRLRSL